MHSIDQHLVQQLNKLHPLSDALQIALQEAHAQLREGHTAHTLNSDLWGELTAVVDDCPAMPIVIRETHFAFKRVHTYETTIAGAFVQTPQSFTSDETAVLSNWISEQFTLSEPKEAHQALAVANAIHWQHSVITGGPGTGKTTTVAKLIGALSQLHSGLRLLLLAPTGKAAQRLETSFTAAQANIKPAANFNLIASSTIHRALYGQQTIKRADVIVVDEASMVDIALAARLINALSEHTKVIWLGDADQLVSVGAGAMMDNLTQAQWPSAQVGVVDAINQASGQLLSLPNGPVARLEGSFRSNKAILALADAINQNQTLNALKAIDKYKELSLNPFRDFYNERFNHCLAHYRAVASCATASEALSKLAQLQVLCPTRYGEYGTDAINGRVRNTLGSDGDALYQGLPILITENSYETGLFNGDIGILWQHNDQLMACFEGDNGLRYLPLSQVAQWIPAYAMTIHKTQGSEYDEVAVTSEEEYMQLNRSLLYTAVTRAKKTCHLYIDKEKLSNALATDQRRVTGLTYQLSDALAAASP